MLQPPTSSETLAHWRYSPDEWRAFCDSELKVQIKSYNSLRNGAIGFAIVAILIMFALILIPYLTMGIVWRADVWGPVIGVAVVSGLILAVIVIYLSILHRKMSSLKLPAGEVLITLNGVSFNGSWLTWNYESPGWRFHNIRRKTLTDQMRKIEVLEFKISAINGNDTRNARGKVKAERVPIPFGKEAEADRIVERLMAEKDRLASSN